MSDDVRYEERDGKTYRVETLPDATPRRRRRKAMMTKEMARGIAVGKQLGAGPPTQFPDQPTDDSLRELREHFKRR